MDLVKEYLRAVAALLPKEPAAVPVRRSA